MTPNAESATMPDHDLTPEQKEFLAAFADNATTGRRVACAIVHMLVAVGTIAGAIAGALALAQSWPWHHS